MYTIKRHGLGILVKPRGARAPTRETTLSKGKGKAGIYIKPSLDKPTSSQLLESLLADPSLYEETKMEERTAGDFSLEDLFGGKLV